MITNIVVFGRDWKNSSRVAEALTREGFQNVTPKPCSYPVFERRYRHIYCVGFTNFVLDVPTVHLCRNSLASLYLHLSQRSPCTNNCRI